MFQSIKKWFIDWFNLPATVHVILEKQALQESLQKQREQKFIEVVSELGMGLEKHVELIQDETYSNKALLELFDLINDKVDRLTWVRPNPWTLLALVKSKKKYAFKKVIDDQFVVVIYKQADKQLVFKIDNEFSQLFEFLPEADFDVEKYDSFQFQERVTTL